MGDLAPSSSPGHDTSDHIGRDADGDGSFCGGIHGGVIDDDVVERRGSAIRDEGDSDEQNLTEVASLDFDNLAGVGAEWKVNDDRGSGARRNRLAAHGNNID